MKNLRSNIKVTSNKTLLSNEGNEEGKDKKVDCEWNGEETVE